MKAVVFEGHSQLHVAEEPAPSAGPGEAIVRVAYSGVCGSDLTLFAGKNPRAKLPVIPGHELSGEVVSVGDALEPSGRGIGPGSRVAILPTLSCGTCDLCRRNLRHLCRSLRFLGIQTNGGMAELVKAPVANLYPVADTLSYEVAALAEPLAVAVHGTRRARVDIGDSVLVIGAGPIGLMVALTATIAGCSRVVVTEVAEQRIRAARALGLETCEIRRDEPISELVARLGGDNAEVVFECTGHPSATIQMIEAGQFAGQVVIVGAFKEPTPVDLFRLSRKELWVTGSFAYTADDFARAIELLTRYGDRFEPLITHVLPLEQTKSAVEMMIRGECVKVLVGPNGDQRRAK